MVNLVPPGQGSGPAPVFDPATQRWDMGNGISLSDEVLQQLDPAAHSNAVAARWLDSRSPLINASSYSASIQYHSTPLSHAQFQQQYDQWVRDQTQTDPVYEEPTMLEQLLKLYTMFMATGVTSPMPHFVGPPGSGKSTVFAQLAEVLGVKLHVINVSRLNPLGLEGLEMPDAGKLQLLISELWTKAQDGDIYLFDEFLRGFPEVYNGLLDIFTAREVAGYKLPKVFIAGASNSTATYDKALEDRLLHLPVPDPRKRKSERTRLSKMIVEQLGLVPTMAESMEMSELMSNEVLPTFEILDHFNGQASRNGNASVKGTSVRKLIGQAKLRQVESQYLSALISANNTEATRPGKTQYMFLLSGNHVPKGYEDAARGIQSSPKLTAIQRENLGLNLQLIEMEKTMRAQRKDTTDDVIDDIEPPF